jgi:hypothetical protein
MAPPWPPPSPSVATTLFAPHEDRCCDDLEHVHLYRRFIDVMFGIWVPPPQNAAAWQSFQDQMNDYRGLNWRFSENSLTLWNLWTFVVHQPWSDPFLSLREAVEPPSLHSSSLIPPPLRYYSWHHVRPCVPHHCSLCSNEDGILSKLCISFQHLCRRSYAAAKILPILLQCDPGPKQDSAETPFPSSRPAVVRTTTCVA